MLCIKISLKVGTRPTFHNRISWEWEDGLSEDKSSHHMVMSLTALDIHTTWFSIQLDNCINQTHVEKDLAKQALKCLSSHA